MLSPRFAAAVLLAGHAALALFQIGLAAGMPWGAYAMGGAYPGVYPPEMRLAALAQVLIYLLIAAIVAARAGFAFARFQPLARTLMWPIVGLFVIALVLNLIPPSAGERALWAPFAVVMLLASLRLALARNAAIA